MKRREFMALAGGAAAWPVIGRAQRSDRVRRIAFLGGGAESGPAAQPRKAALMSTLESLGWVEGRNVTFEFHYANFGDLQQSAPALSDIQKFQPDVIVAQGTPATMNLQGASKTIPIVFVNVADPSLSGLIKNIAHPGGNITGITNLEFSIGGKWLELLKEVAPAIRRVMVLASPESSANPGDGGQVKAAMEAGGRLGVNVVRMPTPDRPSLGKAIDTFASEESGGLIFTNRAFYLDNTDLIVDLARRYRMPAIYPYRDMVVAGGLMSYAADDAELYRKAAAYVNRILRGEKPGDLPVEYPERYRLVVNKRAADEIGLKLAESFLLLADEVIE